MTASGGAVERSGNSPDNIGESAWDNGAPRIVDIFEGDRRLGSIACGRSIRAVRPDGSEISIHPTLEEARLAVVAAFNKEAASS